MLFFATVTVLQLFDLELSDGAFVAEGDSGQWEYGESVTGPTDGRSVWATQLAGPYLSEAYDVLRVPILDATASMPLIEVEHWYNIVAGDQARFEVNDGSGWQLVEPIYGYDEVGGFSGHSGGWVQHVVDLSPFWPDVDFRMTFATDGVGAGDGWYIGAVTVFDGDVAPPNIEPTSLPQDTQLWAGPYTVEALVNDNTEVLLANVEWRIDGGDPIEQPMVGDGSNLFTADIPGQDVGQNVSWRIKAFDGENWSFWPESGWSSFRVFLAEPTDLSAPAGRLVSQTVELSWTSPDTPHSVEGYVVKQSGDPTGARCDHSPCAVAVNPELDTTWTVHGIYDVDGAEILGDPSMPLVVDVAVPELSRILPQAVAPGDRVWVLIEGEYLLLEDSTTLDLGPGTSVSAMQVLDTNQVVFLLTVDESAETGARTLTVDGNIFGRFPEALSVSTAAAKPIIESVEPNQLDQGFQETVVFCPSAPFQGPVSMILGDGLVLAAEPETLANGCVSAELAAQLDAPTGVRTLLLDDGARIWPCEFDIRKTLLSSGRTCSVGLTHLPLWVCPMLLFAVRRRRFTDVCGE